MGILNLSDDEKILSARVKDLIVRCNDRLIPVFTGFLSDREKAVAFEAAGECGFYDSAVAFGGFEDAERTVVGFFPEYSLYLEKSVLYEEFPITALSIRCSGFREHTHRDFLGSMLGLGLERSVIGDIIVGEKGYSATVFVSTGIADFLCENLKLVGRDGVKTSVADKSDICSISKSFESIKGTCASMRLDAVLSEILNISREKSQKLVEEGLVAVNHEYTEDRSRVLALGDIFTVRGFGKYRVSDIGDLNRKGRTRFEVQKYV